MKWISDDDNFWDTWNIGGLIDTTPDNKKFSFCGQNIHSVMNHLDDRFITDVDMSDRGGYIVFNTGVSNH